MSQDDTCCWRKRSGFERGLIAGVVFLALAAIGLLIGLIVIVVQKDRDESNICFSEGCILTAHLLNKNMKFDSDPCDDFYEFACGRFLESTVIPDDKTGVSAFKDIDNLLKDQLKTILNEPIKDSEIKPFKDLKLLNKACLDVSTIENIGASELMAKIQQMGGWPVLSDTWNEDQWSWENTVASMRINGDTNNQIFAFAVTVDPMNSSRRIGAIDQADLGLDYEYMIKREQDEFYLAYRDYQLRVVQLLGANLSYDQIKAQMSQALEFEYLLANISRPSEERRDMNVLYNPMSISKLQEIYPYLNWLEYINSLMPESTKFNVNDIIINAAPSYFEKLQHLLSSTPKSVVANYLMWRFTLNSIPYLSKSFRDLQKNFVETTTGKEQEDPRSLVCTNLIFNYYAHALGSLYARRYFNKEGKDNIMEMVKNLKLAFKEILNELEWMDSKTKEAAQTKVDAMKPQIAYADELLDDAKVVELYESYNVKIDVDNFYGTVAKLSVATTNFVNSKLREAVDKDDWKMSLTPAIVNAFYAFLENTIKFPAAILQGAFFNIDRPQYMNYGAIGFVIGHEITHGFDDQGSLYDSEGNLFNWWDNETRTMFQERAQCLIKQYGDFVEPQTGLKVNGINTQGENIADNGGIKESYRAYGKLVESNGEEKLLPGINLNQRQLFWVSAAQVWCNKKREEIVRSQIHTDNHSPERFRVIGSFGNRLEFSRDFNCKSGSRMNPVEKCSVW